MENEQLSETIPTAEPVTHVYYEVGGELLSKPNALCDIVELQGGSSTVIFCNSPSDADLAEVMLKKRGVNVRKLVGHVPPLKVHEATQALINGQLAALVITDVSARGVELHNLNLVINYSLPDDPEIYLHRTAVHIEPSASTVSTGKPAAYRRVASLISPLDIGNFHYLKKISNLQFSRIDLPKAEDLIAIRVNALRRSAEAKACLHDPRLAAATKLVLEGEDREQLISFLLYNTLDVIPSLASSAERPAAAPSERRERSDYEGGNTEGRRSGGDRGGDYGRGGRGEGRGRGGRDRGGRDRRDDRFARGGERGNRGGQPRFESEGEPYSEDQNSAHESNESYGNSSRGEGEQTRGHQSGAEGYDQESGRRRGGRGGRSQSLPPAARDYRIYIGHGSREGVKEENLRSMVAENCQIAPDQIKRVILRDRYSFVDVPEEIADSVVEKLGTSAIGSASSAFVRKAVTISAPRPNVSEDSDFEGSSEGSEVHADDAGASYEEGSSSDASERDLSESDQGRSNDQGSDQDWQR